MQCASDDAALAARYSELLRAGSADDLRALVLLSGLPSDANVLSTGGAGAGAGPREGHVDVDIDAGNADANANAEPGSHAHGSVPDAPAPPRRGCSLRGLVWKALLRIGPLDPAEYATLVRKGPSADDHRVREDARRTFSKNDDFCARVPNAKIIRVLNAYVHSAGNTRGIYAQSMSLLAAPFLYVMPEPDAFHCFRVFLTRHVQLYVRRYVGARRGCRLLDRCLADVDPQLHALFAAHNLNAEVYAFPSISSLGACVQPMSDTVRLWDIQLAFGAHMHIVFTLARLLLASPAILEAAGHTSAAPLITRELEQGLGVDSETVIARAVPLVCQIDPNLYSELLQHATVPPGLEIDEASSVRQENSQRTAFEQPSEHARNVTSNGRGQAEWLEAGVVMSDVPDVSVGTELGNRSRTDPRIDQNSSCSASIGQQSVQGKACRENEREGSHSSNHGPYWQRRACGYADRNAESRGGISYAQDDHQATAGSHHEPQGRRRRPRHSLSYQADSLHRASLDFQGPNVDPSAGFEGTPGVASVSAARSMASSPVYSRTHRRHELHEREQEHEVGRDPSLLDVSCPPGIVSVSGEDARNASLT